MNNRALFTGWSRPLGFVPAPAVTPLRWATVLVRLYAGIIFIPYGWDKIVGNNQQYGMDATFFQSLGVPFPELAQVVVAVLELFGGLAFLGGLFTRGFAILLACDMLVAMTLVGNYAVEAPLFLAGVALVILGGGKLSADQLVDLA